MKKRWSINGRFLAQPFSGVQRYAYEILYALDELMSKGDASAKGLELELVVPSETPNLPVLSAIAVKRAGKGKGHVWEQTVLPAVAGDGVLSLCNSGPLSIRQQIVCIHDVNVRLFPDSYSRAFRTLYRLLHPALGRRARRIATVSRYSAKMLAGHAIAPARKILVATNGFEHALRWTPEFSDRVRAAATPYTVFVLGSPAPHKNVGMLMTLADRLGDAGINIAVAGPTDSRVFHSLLDGQSARNIHWLGRITDNEIAAILSKCLCLAFPSYVEGFGLPAVEAMAWGCPVIASDRTSLPEIGGEAVLYAPPDAPEIWLSQILRLHEDNTLRESMILSGRKQARAFSWRTSAARYLQAMTELE
ncbi:MAG TPA: glycosyltransferase family 1 protein [Hyphomicrobiales bacterium]|nr:glycosyltransferase family 1 protein [Hyphomicrobiales bacterium]